MNTQSYVSALEFYYSHQQSNCRQKVAVVADKKNSEAVIIHVAVPEDFKLKGRTPKELVMHQALE